MDRARHDLLAHAGLAENEDADLPARHALDDGLQSGHRSGRRMGGLGRWDRAVKPTARRREKGLRGPRVTGVGCEVDLHLGAELAYAIADVVDNLPGLRARAVDE